MSSSYEVDDVTLGATGAATIQLGETLRAAGDQIAEAVQGLRLYEDDPGLPPVDHRATALVVGLGEASRSVIANGDAMVAVATDARAADDLPVRIETVSFGGEGEGRILAGVGVNGGAEYTVEYFGDGTALITRTYDVGAGPSAGGDLGAQVWWDGGEVGAYAAASGEEYYGPVASITVRVDTHDVDPMDVVRDDIAILMMAGAGRPFGVHPRSLSTTTVTDDVVEVSFGLRADVEGELDVSVGGEHGDDRHLFSKLLAGEGTIAAVQAWRPESGTTVKRMTGDAAVWGRSASRFDDEPLAAQPFDFAENPLADGVGMDAVIEIEYGPQGEIISMSAESTQIVGDEAIRNRSTVRSDEIALALHEWDGGGPAEMWNQILDLGHRETQRYAVSSGGFGGRVGAIVTGAELGYERETFTARPPAADAEGDG